MTAPNIATLSYFLLVADVDTPANVQAYAGQVVGIPSSMLAGIGSGPDNPGHLVGLFGYRRPYSGPTVGGVTIAAEWYLAPIVPAAVAAAFEQIPGPPGWVVTASHDTYANLGITLITNPAPAGYPAATVLNALNSFYQGAKNELVQRFNQGLPL